jgi:DNA-binding transcriptional regulator YiaG
MDIGMKTYILSDEEFSDFSNADSDLRNKIWSSVAQSAEDEEYFEGYVAAAYIASSDGYIEEFQTSLQGGSVWPEDEPRPKNIDQLLWDNFQPAEYRIDDLAHIKKELKERWAHEVLSSPERNWGCLTSTAIDAIIRETTNGNKALFARKLGVSRQYLYELLSGESTPSKTLSRAMLHLLIERRAH